MQNTKSQKAFTLIELLIVIAIIGILAVSLLPSILNAPAQARDVARKAAVGDIKIAIESYRATNAKLPGTAGSGVCMTDDSSTPASLIAPILKDGVKGLISSKQITKPVGACTDPSIYYFQTAADEYYVCVGTDNEGTKDGGFYQSFASNAEPAALSTGTSAVYCQKG